jgi:hypothetical protein
MVSHELLGGGAEARAWVSKLVELFDEWEPGVHVTARGIIGSRTIRQPVG